MGAREPGNALDVASIARDFERVRRGYDPAAVDHHLALITSQVKMLIETRAAADPDESLDLVLKATRRSVDEALQDARGRADHIVAAATEEADAVKAEATERCRALDAEGRERYAEMGRLTASRAEKIAELDEEIAERQQVLRAAAGDLERLAAGLSEPVTAEVRGIAAMDAGSVEIVLPAQPVSDR